MRDDSGMMTVPERAAPSGEIRIRLPDGAVLAGVAACR
jgi:hypothetical protein